MVTSVYDSKSMIQLPATVMLEHDFEVGEIILDKNQLATIYGKSCCPHSVCKKQQVGSAHNILNSYEFNPWNQKFNDTGTSNQTIFNQANMLKCELQHLRLLLR
jgi:hypothetical protein